MSFRRKNSTKNYLCYIAVEISIMHVCVWLNPNSSNNVFFFQNHIVRKNFKTMTVFMWWTDFSDYGSSVFLEAHMGVIRASILIPWEVVVGTLSFHGLSNTRLRREDNLINNVVNRD